MVLSRAWCRKWLILGADREQIVKLDNISMNCLVVGLVEMIGSNKPNYKLHLRLGCGREAITQVWEAGASLSARMDVWECHMSTLHRILMS